MEGVAQRIYWAERNLGTRKAPSSPNSIDAYRPRDVADRTVFENNIPVGR
jgi:hypothetical protein